MTTTNVNGAGAPIAKPTVVIAIKDDAVAALKQLGYGEKLARDAVERTTRDLAPDAPLDAVIKASLQHLGAKSSTPPKNGPNPQPMKALPAPKAPKPEKPKPVKVGKMEGISIDGRYLLAAVMCAADDETRYYLNGVFIHRTADRFVRVVATDGHRCIIANLYREDEKKPGPKWLDQGIIVPSDGLAARVKLIEKEQKDSGLGVQILFGENQPRVEIADAMGINVFRVKPVDGTFPDYERVTTAGWSGMSVDRADWKPTGFNPAYLKAVGEIAKRLDPETAVQCYDYAAPDGGAQPVLFTFEKVPNVVLFLMPTRVEHKMGAATRLLLAPAVKGSIAALKAHETRNREAAKDLKGAEKEAALAKADEFAKRIKAVLENTGSGAKQLEAPKALEKAAEPPKAPEPPKPQVPPKIAEAAKPLTPILDKAAKRTVVGNGGKKPVAKKARR